MPLARRVTTPKTIRSLSVLVLALGLGTALPAFADEGHILVLDCTRAVSITDLVVEPPVVYLAGKGFDPSKLADSGSIPQDDFEAMAKAGLRKPPDTIRFKIAKDDEVDAYIVSSIPLEASEQVQAPGNAPLQWVSDPMTWVAPGPARPGAPMTAVGGPLTISTLKEARLLISEQQRPAALESGSVTAATALFAVVLKQAAPPQASAPAPGKVYYYRLHRYKMRFDNSYLTLSFQDQNGNQQQIATVVTGRPENWFLMAGGPVYAYAPRTGSSGDNPTGLYVGLDWTPNDVFDPDPRLLIVNLLDVNTTNVSSAVGLIGLGMGFPRINSFIPLSTLSVTETLGYNLQLNKFQWLTMVNYDVTDVLQFLKF